MVHVKRVELTNFKSFGGTTQVPLLPGFTVVSGPNGSGKSNILDALLFCLGIASSKGMRAERLPDLVNHNKERRGTVEANVTVTFDLSDAPETFAGNQEQEVPVLGESLTDNYAGNGHQTALTENSSSPEESENYQPHPLKPETTEWSVTRRLRVTRQGTYTSTYYINGESCTQTELHEQLNKLRVYPEGYNVVLQGDVTGIITMKPRERREIIDELAGVAAFDRKISQTRQTLDQVKEREDRCRIIEKELIAQRDRLAAESTKAKKYQKLRAEVQEKQQWEIVLQWRSLQQQQAQLRQQIELGQAQETQLNSQLRTLAAQLEQATTELEQLNARVKALGEEEQLALASTLATQKAQQRQLSLRRQELRDRLQQTKTNLQKTQEQIQHNEQTLEQLKAEKHHVETQELASKLTARDEAQTALNHSREQANAIASASDAWVQQQTALNRNSETLLQSIDPQRTEQARLRERQSQLNRVIAEQTQLLQNLEPEIATKQAQAAELEAQLQASAQQIPSLAQSLAATERELQIQQQTQTRLLSEQRDKQRQLDKLEAQAQAQQEAQGTYATKVLLETGIPGVCGLVAQLGRVEPRYQLALETSAGQRLGHLVVEDDGVAAAGIELLKQKRAGRATFLPLNKIQPPRFTETVALRYARGFVDYAVNLIEHELRYEKIFAYVFGSTVVFETLNDARHYLGKHRIVTLEGEILESSGAMSGGSRSQRSGLHFGTSDATESSEMAALKNRLQEIEIVLERCGDSIENSSASVKQMTQTLTEVKAQSKETQLRWEQLNKEVKNLAAQQHQVTLQLAQNTQEQQTTSERLHVLNINLPTLEAQLQELRQQLAQLEESQTPNEWQQIQSIIKGWEAKLHEGEQALLTTEKQLLDLENQQQRLGEKTTEDYRKITEYQTQQQSCQDQQSTLDSELLAMSEQITQTEVLLSQIEQQLGEVKQKRDRAEIYLSQQQQQHQQLSWQLQKLQETQLARQEEFTSRQTQLQLQEAELPNPLPEVPPLINHLETESHASASQVIAFDSFAAHLEQLQKEIKNAQKRLQAMEPVNMLALEEYETTQVRLQELSEKLATLEAERTELLLRVENFTTLRLQAFKEAFDAINHNFQTIFAELSDGDGYLQLDDSENPFEGGLNLVAHPKGKPVQRLASMSGGEKSLTALSFIFALQRYRPSPFYAFDEVDMFLDGANVERLARMIKQEAMLAQFIVVSLRRPMIESAERTIGVTQARGAYTQVLGLKLPPKNATR
ncbi:chromosome segregation protein SMC [Lyngbya aestuarii]|uniref:chromosome segregation protein SMC n=1 Tax=Lyngbya aestuarii TaxID=118322 RepID=UPI00403E169A